MPELLKALLRVCVHSSNRDGHAAPTCKPCHCQSCCPCPCPLHLAVVLCLMHPSAHPPRPHPRCLQDWFDDPVHHKAYLQDGNRYATVLLYLSGAYAVVVVVVTV